MLKSLKNIKINVTSKVNEKPKIADEQIQELKEKISMKAENAIKLVADKTNDRQELNNMLGKLLPLSKMIDVLPQRIEEADVLLNEYKNLESKIDEVIKGYEKDSEITL